ncbi:MAG: PDZ domain-containing protein [Calditrichaeota bacterium]|nr:PDZ domain-containing protein [Calditrichota bacterium]
MKKLLTISLLIVFTSLSAFTLFAVDKSGDNGKIPVFEPLPIHPRIEQAIAFFLPKMHYKHQQVDDELSMQMLDFYLEMLDNQHLYFLKSDIDGFEQYRYTLDDALRNGDLRAAYSIFNRFMERFEERMAYVKSCLKTPFDFEKKDYYQLDRRDAPWAKTSAELDSIWKKRLKNEALSLKLTGKKWDDIVKRLRKRYTNMEKQMRKTQSEDVFQIYMNAFAQTFDPHTNYMSPKTSDDFKIRMSLSLEGIGASLRTEDDYTKVVEIIPGGPADRSGLLHPNDRIVAVGQGKEGELVDIIGWRIDDVVQLIRGPKGTTVRLQIIPADASLSDPPKTITLVRDKIKLSDRAAKSDTLEIEHNGKKYRFGVINIPDFYLDYEAMRKGQKDYASTSRDVERLLKELQGANVDGIIIDLRRNGGGFLSEAVDLTGLFIKDGPVVQVRDSRGRVKVERDTDKKLVYDGPLAVLVDRFSASASEIFAAAIQDYNRGIIVGTQTFGKGTVQNIMPLSRMFPYSKDKLGQIKFTVAKFYRITGASTQNIGVLPDITIPSRFDVMEVGESSEKNALLWDEIDPVSFKPFNTELDKLIPRLARQHEARVQNSREFKLLMKEIEQLKKDREKNKVSLNLEERKKLREEREARKKQLDEIHKKTGHNKNEDFYMLETAHILSDYITLTH